MKRVNVIMVAITIILEIPRFAPQRYEETEVTENSYCYALSNWASHKSLYCMQKVFLTECEYANSKTTPTKSDPLPHWNPFIPFSSLSSYYFHSFNIIISKVSTKGGKACFGNFCYLMTRVEVHMIWERCDMKKGMKMEIN